MKKGDRVQFWPIDTIDVGESTWNTGTIVASGHKFASVLWDGAHTKELTSVECLRLIKPSVPIYGPPLPAQGRRLEL